MPRHKKKKRAAAAPAVSVKRTDWLVGDLVVAKLRGHRPWPAQIQKPEDYGYDARPHRIFVTFFGTEETCFCSYNKITPFTGAVRKSLAEQLQKINTNAELERAIKEIFAADDEIKMSIKSHASLQKEDEDMASEKSEDEEQPVERSRKRARVVEEAVPVVQSRPAKQEKTVKTMAAEQVQKLPRKVRIKVSSQTSDSGNQQGGGVLPVSDKASVSSSQARNSDPSPPRTNESAGPANLSVKNGDIPATAKVGESVGGRDSSVTLKEDNVAGDVHVTTRLLSENGDDATEKIEVDDVSDSKESLTSKTGDVVVEKMEVDNEKSLPSKTDGLAIRKEGDKLALVIDEPVKVDESSSKVEDSRCISTIEKQESERPAVKVEDPPAVEEMEISGAAEEKVTLVTKEEEVVPSKDEDSQVERTAVKVQDPPVVEEMEISGAVEEKVPVVTKEEEVVPSKDEVSQRERPAVKVEGPPAVEEMEISGAVEEKVPLVSKKDEVVPSKDEDSRRVLGPELGREGKSERELEAVASTIPDVVDDAKPGTAKDPLLSSTVSACKEGDEDRQRVSGSELDREVGVERDLGAVVESMAPDAVDEPKRCAARDPVPAVSVSACKQEEGAEGEAGVLSTQVSTTTAKEVASQSEVHDGALNGEASKDAETMPRSETEVSQPGVVKQTEDHDGTMKRTESQDGAVIQKKDLDGRDTLQIGTEKSDLVKKAEDHDGPVKQSESQVGAVVTQKDRDGVDTPQIGTEKSGVVSLTRDHDGPEKRPEGQDGAVALKDRDVVDTAQI